MMMRGPGLLATEMRPVTVPVTRTLGPGVQLERRVPVCQRPGPPATVTASHTILAEYPGFESESTLTVAAAAVLALSRCEAQSVARVGCGCHVGLPWPARTAQTADRQSGSLRATVTETVTARAAGDCRSGPGHCTPAASMPA